MFAAGVASSPSGAVVLSTSPDSTVSIDSVWTGDLGLGGITVVVNEKHSQATVYLTHVRLYTFLDVDCNTNVTYKGVSRDTCTLKPFAEC